MVTLFCAISDQTVLCSQESAKVSDLNPNAKAWANHMFSLDPSGTADTTPAALQPWKEGCDSPADPGTEGQITSELGMNSIFTTWPFDKRLYPSSASLKGGYSH